MGVQVPGRVLVISPLPNITLQRTTSRPIPYIVPTANPGYWDWLQKQKPQRLVDAAKIRSREDWIKAGEIAFAFWTSHFAARTIHRSSRQCVIPSNGRVCGHKWIAV